MFLFSCWTALITYALSIYFKLYELDGWWWTCWFTVGKLNWCCAKLYVAEMGLIDRLPAPVRLLAYCTYYFFCSSCCRWCWLWSGIDCAEAYMLEWSSSASSSKISSMYSSSALLFFGFVTSLKLFRLYWRTLSCSAVAVISKSATSFFLLLSIVWFTSSKLSE